MSQGYDIAIIGAANAVTPLIIEMLEARGFPLARCCVLDQADRLADTLLLDGKRVEIALIDEADFNSFQFAFFVSDQAVSLQAIPLAIEAGCAVIDCSGAYADESDVPAVVATVNAGLLAEAGRGSLISCPADSTILLAKLLQPLHDAAGLLCVDVFACLSVSEFGKAAVDELAEQTTGLLNMQEITPQFFSKQLAFNVIPDEQGMTDSFSSREQTLTRELKSVFKTSANGGIEHVHTSAMVVPVFYGQGMMVHLTLKAAMNAEQAAQLLAQGDGLEWVDDVTGPTLVTDGLGQDQVFYGRVRQQAGEDKNLSLWLCADSHRAGQALNCVQIAEIIKENL